MAPRMPSGPDPQRIFTCAVLDMASFESRATAASSSCDSQALFSAVSNSSFIGITSLHSWVPGQPEVVNDGEFIPVRPPRSAPSASPGDSKLLNYFESGRRINRVEVACPYRFCSRSTRRASTVATLPPACTTWPSARSVPARDVTDLRKLTLSSSVV